MLDNGPDVLDIGLRREIGTDEFAPAREAGRATEGHDMVFNAVPEDQQKIMARAFDAPLQLKAATTLGGFEKRGDLGNSGLKGSLRAGRHLNPRDFCYHGLSNERRTWPISCARPFKVRAQSPGAEYRTCLRISGRRARRDRFSREIGRAHV